MKILLAGDFGFFWYEEACAQALEKLGHQVIRFPWGKFFTGKIGAAQHRFLVGPSFYWLNRELLKLGCEVRPDVIFIWRGTPIWAGVLGRLKQKSGALLVSYNNDDAFGPSRDRFLWRHFITNIPLYDLHFVYRKLNFNEYFSAGAKHVELLLPYFIPELHHPVSLTPDEQKQFGCDAVFVGHYENDGRVEYLRALVDAGLHLRLYGGKYWNVKSLGDLHEYFGRVSPVFGADYVKALVGAKLCLSFLSRLNRDTYTRRTFEIPACNALMVSERTDDLGRFFKEDEEAVYFSTPDELVEKAIRLVRDDSRRKEIAQAGYLRCLTGKHDVVNRMQEFSVTVSQFLKT